MEFADTGTVTSYPQQWATKLRKVQSDDSIACTLTAIRAYTGTTGVLFPIFCFSQEEQKTL